MYESKYNRFITKCDARFAEHEEIMQVSSPAFTPQSKAAGVPLYYNNGTLYVDNGDSHSLIIGPTGSKKSRITAFSTLASVIEAGESAIVNDPKGELYRLTALRAKEKGAKTILINLRNPAASNCWNPLTQAKIYLNDGKRDKATQSINDFVETVIAPSMQKTTDNYWGDSSKKFLTGILLILAESLSLDTFNLKTLLPFCYSENLPILKNVLSKMDPSALASISLKGTIDLEAERTLSCIYSTLSTTFRPFIQSTSLLDILSTSTINIENIGKTQTLVYILYPDEKDTLNFLVNLFITQSYEMLINAAAESPNDKLPIRVNYILDEFSNLVPVNNFTNKISQCRSKNIRYHLFCQSFSQLKSRYGEGTANTITSNCTNWICFSSKEIEFLSTISNICGNEVDFNGHSRPIISPLEMQHLQKKAESAEVLIIKQGMYPFVSELPDFEYLKASELYEKTTLPVSITNAPPKTVTPHIWHRKITNNLYKFPFPSEDQTA